MSECAFLGVQEMQASPTMMESSQTITCFSLFQFWLSDLYIYLGICAVWYCFSFTDFKVANTTAEKIPWNKLICKSQVFWMIQTHFRYAKSRNFSNHAGYCFFIEYAMLCSSQIYYWAMTLNRIYVIPREIDKSNYRSMDKFVAFLAILEEQCGIFFLDYAGILL